MIKLGHISFAALMAAGFMVVSPVLAPTASAQTTTQTDESEEDWRKSQKKPGSDDIYEDIRNNRSTGQGNVQTGPSNTLDTLPEESRRHLTRERAKALASAGDPNDISDAAYTPSEAAKGDERLARREKRVWNELIGNQGGQGQGQQGQQGQSQAGQQGCLLYTSPSPRDLSTSRMPSSA